MPDVLRYLWAALILLWLLFDIYNLYIIGANPNVRLLHGRVIEVAKYTGYNNASLKLLVKTDNTNDLVWIISKFRPNLRWWLQKVPGVNQDVYYYVKDKTLVRDNELQTVYGISPVKQGSRFKLVADLFYERSRDSTIFVALAFIFIVVAMHKMFGSAGVFTLYPSIYWLVRMFIEGVVV